jgi:drug/metabolite transporter (DMT)-like permease
VGWVILLRKKNGNGTVSPGASRRLFEREITVRGVLLAFGGAIGQAVGFIFSKIGMTYNGAYLDPFAATQIRVIGGTLGFVVLFFILGWWTKVFKALQNKPALGFMAAGSFMGPYLGVSLSLLALHYTTAGVASTIMSLVPIALIPFVIIIHKEHVSIHSFVGTVIAIAGVFMLIN